MRGRIQPRNLKQQVAVERKRRDVIFFTIIILFFFYIGITMLFGDMGYFKYSKLKKISRLIESDIRGLEKENETLRTQVKLLKEDNYYIEKYAREEYGLARPDEYIFQFNENDR